MCRILLIKTSKPESQTELLEKFASMCEQSKAPDGDWQGDGFGISWLDESQNWQIVKSTEPIWNERAMIEKVPKSKIIVAHARSATFKSQMLDGDTSYNQPYTNEDFSFVFNGHLEGVKLSRKIDGKTGAEKIWNLLNEKLVKSNPAKSLGEILAERENDTKKIHAMNIGISDKINIYGLCRYEPNDILPDYHKLRYYSDENIKIICSEPIGDYQFSYLKNSEIIIL
jgi:predicted glutamine amidotransferase